METVIVEICMGITGSVSDFILPAHVPVAALISELIKLIEQVYPHITFDRDMPILYEMEKGLPIPMNATLAQAGIRDSSRLLLV